jgi:hypothetical protein
VLTDTNAPLNWQNAPRDPFSAQVGEAALKVEVKTGGLLVKMQLDELTEGQLSSFVSRRLLPRPTDQATPRTDHFWTAISQLSESLEEVEKASEASAQSVETCSGAMSEMQIDMHVMEAVLEAVRAP